MATASDQGGVRAPVRLDASVIGQMLTYPLLSPSPRWTSQDLARAVGVSQATVSRWWTHAFDPSPLADEPLVADLGEGWTPIGVYADRTVAALALTRRSAHDRGSGAELAPGVPQRHRRFSMRSPARRPAQSMLAVAELAARTGTNEGSRQRQAWLAELAACTGHGPVVVLCTAQADGAPLALDRLSSRVLTRFSVIAIAPQHWQNLLAWLGRAVGPTRTSALADLEEQVRRWARHPERPLAATSPPAARPWSAPLHRTAGDRPTDLVADAILAGVSEGELAAGARVTEAWLMRRTHVTRTHAREALRELALDGLISLSHGRGATLPPPRPADVLETYELREHLGAMIVREAAAWRPGQLRPAQGALNRLRHSADRGDHWQAGQEDLDFQDALAGVGALRRSRPMFLRMTQQIRFFIALHRLDYTFPAGEMMTSDAAILRALVAREADTAVRLWTGKITASRAYLIAQL